MSFRTKPVYFCDIKTMISLVYFIQWFIDSLVVLDVGMPRSFFLVHVLLSNPPLSTPRPAPKVAQLAPSILRSELHHWRNTLKNPNGSKLKN